MSSVKRYEPVQEGQPIYVTPMLRDAGREEAFYWAIKAKVEEFKKITNRSPRIVDLGAGTGLLSKLALDCGAEHVTLVDVNNDLLNMASAALGRHAYKEGEHFAIFRGSFTKMTYPVDIWSGESFDMLVCEILGTLTTSESQHIYIPDALKFVKRIEGHGQFVIPSSATQMLSLCKLSVMDERNLCCCYPHDNLISDWEDDSVLRFVPTNDLQLYNLHLKPFEVLQSEVIRIDKFDGGNDVLPKEVSLCVPSELGRNHFLVLEWTCTLSDGVELKNTLEGYKESPATSVDRAVAWGFLLANCDALYNMCDKKVRFSISYPKDKKGWPRIFYFKKRKHTK